MKTKTRRQLLAQMAKKNPYVKDVGIMWKNPQTKRRIRWTRKDLDYFREEQQAARL